MKLEKLLKTVNKLNLSEIGVLQWNVIQEQLMKKIKTYERWWSK